MCQSLFLFLMLSSSAEFHSPPFHRLLWTQLLINRFPWLTFILQFSGPVQIKCEQCSKCLGVFLTLCSTAHAGGQAGRWIPTEVAVPWLLWEQECVSGAPAPLFSAHVCVGAGTMPFLRHLPAFLHLCHTSLLSQAPGAASILLIHSLSLQ